MKRFAWLATFLVALLCGALGLLLVLPLGLIVIEWVIFPTALVVGALQAPLAASWVGTWLADDGTRTRLAAVVAVAQAAGLLLDLVVLGSAAGHGALIGPVIGIAGTCDLVLAITASVATWAVRRPAEQPQRDLARTLVLLALAVVGVPLIEVAAGLVGLVGA